MCVRKKQRGIKRKLKSLIFDMNKLTEEFPNNIKDDYWELTLPFTQDFIDSPKVRPRIKKLDQIIKSYNLLLFE